VAKLANMPIKRQMVIEMDMYTSFFLIAMLAY